MLIGNKWDSVPLFHSSNLLIRYMNILPRPVPGPRELIWCIPTFRYTFTRKSKLQVSFDRACSTIIPPEYGTFCLVSAFEQLVDKYEKVESKPEELQLLLEEEKANRKVIHEVKPPSFPFEMQCRLSYSMRICAKSGPRLGASTGVSSLTKYGIGANQRTSYVFMFRGH